MHLSPDELVYWQMGWFKLNATICITWGLMLILLAAARLATWPLRAAAPPAGPQAHQGGQVDQGVQANQQLPAPQQLPASALPRWRTRWHQLLEIAVVMIEGQLAAAGLAEPRPYLGFLGTLLLFVAASSLGTVLPGYLPPTGSLSTTAALALCVLVAVPAFGISRLGLKAYLRTYAEPNLVMVPFNIIGELSRTLALAIRLFGNMMSGAMIVAILLAITPLIFPVVMTLLGLLTGMVQAYIFFVLATVYVAAATRVRPSPHAAGQAIADGDSGPEPDRNDAARQGHGSRPDANSGPHEERA